MFFTDLQSMDGKTKPQNIQGQNVAGTVSVQIHKLVPPLGLMLTVGVQHPLRLNVAFSAVS